METDCYCTSLRVAARRATAIYDRALAPAGINVAQWGLLRRLSGPRGEPVTIQELAERADLERSTVARNVRVLEKRGLVSITASAADRRASEIVMTSAAAAVIEQALPLWKSAQAEIEAALTKDSAGTLRVLALTI